MENEELKNFSDRDNSIVKNSSAVNKLILDYYKKFGRKRDIEQFFSLSTAQQDLSDPTSLFWKKMKEQNDSSDSGDKKTSSSTELCRISIKCTMEEPHTAQEGNKNTESDTESPPIISDDVPDECMQSDNESSKSDGTHSHKSIDVTLGTSMNRPHSPTSSITSQRKLEWDSLADVGYANESDRKNSASSLSTLERLALHQQYSNNDTKQSSDLGLPTAQSTPLEQNESKSKGKKDMYKISSKFFNKDVDIMEVNLPKSSDIIHQPINVNLTKHISFNVERDGNIRMDNMFKNISVNQENLYEVPEETPKTNVDKQIQTTLLKNNFKDNIPKDYSHRPKLPVLINLNNLKRRNLKKKRKRKVSKQRKKITVNKENIPQEKNVNQESDAESFEYMPGYVYNQNEFQNNNPEMNIADNKSSLESSAGHTTESSRDLKCAFTKELEKSIDLLKLALQHHYKDTSLKKKLIREVVQSLVKTKYKGDESSSEYMSGLSKNNTITSTSDSNNLDNRKPKKSILRTQNFNSSAIASTSQSAPNLPTISNVDDHVKPPRPSNLSSTDSDPSYKSKYLSEVVLANSSSEEIYKKYLMALKKENLYKKHLKENDLLLRQSVTNPNEIINTKGDLKTKSNLEHLIKDLARNNHADGSGDASKLHCASSSNVDAETNSLHRFRSHSVFTLSSGNTDNQKKNKKLRNRLESGINSSLESSTNVKCHCSASRRDKIPVTDSSVQVNFISQPEALTDRKTDERNFPEENKQKTSARREQNKKGCKEVSDKCTEDVQYVCLCTEESQEVPENFLIYKCSRLHNKCIMIGSNIQTNFPQGQRDSRHTLKCMDIPSNIYLPSDSNERKGLAQKDNAISTQSSQTEFDLPKLILRSSSNKSICSSSSECKCYDENKDTTKPLHIDKPMLNICGGTRWVQTEFSIDPKISDPSLTDIRIIDDKCCDTINHEQNKRVSELSSDHNKYKNSDSNKYDNKVLFVKNKTDQEIDKYMQIDNNIALQSPRHKRQDENKTTCRQKENNNDTHLIYSKTTLSPRHKTQQENDATNLMYSKTTQPQNKFTIPIHGTNMTLKVTLGSADEYSLQNKMTTENKTTSSQESLASSSVKTSTSDVKSCRSEVMESNKIMSSKEIQTENVDVQTKVNKNTEGSLDINNDSTKLCCGQVNDIQTPNTSCNTYNSISDRKYSTYPKESILKKPLLRSNTDTDKMESFDPFTLTNKKDINTQCDPVVKPLTKTKATATNISNSSKSSYDTKCSERSKIGNKEVVIAACSTSNSVNNKKSSSSDPLLDIICDITKRYSKKDLEKGKRKKCYNEIINVLNYLLDTSESTDKDENKELHFSTRCTVDDESAHSSKRDKPKKTFQNKSIQLSPRKLKPSRCCESSDGPVSTDIPSTSTEFATCKMHRRHECEKHHKCKCKFYPKKCEASSSSSLNCEQCKHCYCRGHKSHRLRSLEKSGKKCVAYNLILQTSDSIASEEGDRGLCGRQLKNIVVKVPSKRRVDNMQFKEVAQKIERDLPRQPCYTATRSRSVPRDKDSSTDNVNRVTAGCTVRDYLEKNRPDFVERSSRRQSCLKSINEARPDCDKHLSMVVVHAPNCHGNEPTTIYCGGIPTNVTNVASQCTEGYYNMCCFPNQAMEVATERASKRQVLSVHVGRGAPVGALSEADLRQLAGDLGRDLRTRKVAPKFINEKEMKKHSEKIYKSLPEVQRKKEEMKKETIKKTNLLMANIFKKNLQKKTLRGAVNLSNYSAVIKI